MKLENYFNRQLIGSQNGYLENDEEHAGVANVPRKWVWNIPDNSSQLWARKWQNGIDWPR